MVRYKSGAALLAVMLVAQGAQAKDLFSVSGTVSDIVNGQPVQQAFNVSFKKADDVISFTEAGKFRQTVPIYRDDISAINGTINFRGVDIKIVFAQNDRRLQFSVPSIGETRTFNGVDRDDSLDQLEDYITKNSSDFLQRFQKALIKASPNDPTAGNPNSLQSSMIAGDFSAAGFNTDGTTQSTVVANSTENKVFFGVSAGTFRAQGVSGQTISLPLSYTARFDDDPRYQLKFSLPITYINQAGAKTGAVTLGLGFQFPLTSIESKNQWYLTPNVSVGGTGSIDAGAASLLANFSLTSRYVFNGGSAGFFTLANMLAYNMSIPFTVDDVHGDYDIKNLVFKNGLSWEKPLDFALFGKGQTSIITSYAWTKFTGTDLYMNNYHDISLSIGRFNTGEQGSILRVGGTATFGRDFHKYVFNLGYTF